VEDLPEELLVDEVLAVGRAVLDQLGESDLLVPQDGGEDVREHSFLRRSGRAAEAGAGFAVEGVGAVVASHTSPPYSNRKLLPPGLPGTEVWPLRVTRCSQFMWRSNVGQMRVHQSTRSRVNASGDRSSAAMCVAKLRFPITAARPVFRSHVRVDIDVRPDVDTEVWPSSSLAVTDCDFQELAPRCNGSVHARCPRSLRLRCEKWRGSFASAAAGVPVGSG
jgi:hypothetical protein